MLAAVVFLEVILRLIGYGSISNLGYGPLQSNLGLPVLGYAGRPNIDGIQMREGYSHLVLNNQGFHDVNVQREKPAGDGPGQGSFGCDPGRPCPIASDR